MIGCGDIITHTAHTDREFKHLMFYGVIKKLRLLLINLFENANRIGGDLCRGYNNNGLMSGRYVGH